MKIMTCSKILSILVLVVLTACSAEFPNYSSGIIPLYEQPADWKDETSRSETIKIYSKYLEGKTFFLDPGHGGTDRKNISPNKKVTEADINLRVALNLRKYLEEAGAHVVMSRTDDSTVDLKTRAELANDSNADIVISIHHNAGGSNDDYWSDYTATYYHSSEDKYDYEPCSRDLARYIQRDLAYVMRNSGGLGSFDGAYSDYVLYPKEGFYMLRMTKNPAVLIECSFHTSRFEEARLAIPEFNAIEAWGIFRGIGKYFKSGIPVISYEDKLSTLSKDNTLLVFSFDDKNVVDERSIEVFCDSLKVNYEYNKNVNILEVSLNKPLPGEHTIRIIAANTNKNHSFPFYKKITIE